MATGQTSTDCLPEDALVPTPESYIGGVIDNGTHRIDSINAIGSKFVVFNLRNIKSGEIDQVAKILKEEFDPRAPLLKALPQAAADMTRNPDRVIKICDRLLKLDPTIEAAAFDKGVAHDVKGETAPALEAFNLALSIAPGDVWNLVYRATCYASLKRDKECLDDVLAAAATDGELLKTALLQLRRSFAAIRCSLQRLAQENPGSEAARMALQAYFGPMMRLRLLARRFRS